MILALVALAAAQPSASSPPIWTEQVAGFVVTSGDYRQCPYETVASIKKTVRLDFLWTKVPDNAQAASLLGNEARAVGADAVVFVVIGKRHLSLLGWNAVDLRGRAVRFTDPSCSPVAAYAKARTTGPLVVPVQP